MQAGRYVLRDHGLPPTAKAVPPLLLLSAEAKPRDERRLRELAAVLDDDRLGGLAGLAADALNGLHDLKA